MSGMGCRIFSWMYMVRVFFTDASCVTFMKGYTRVVRLAPGLTDGEVFWGFNSRKRYTNPPSTRCIANPDRALPQPAGNKAGKTLLTKYPKKDLKNYCCSFVYFFQICSR